MPVQGTDIVAKNLVAFGQGFTRHVNTVMKSVGADVLGKVRENIGFSDHSLAALRDLDHPYARRHGPQGKHLHDLSFQAHRQSGVMYTASFATIREASIDGGRLEAAAIVGINELQAPHAAQVIFGTSRMIPRDFLSGTVQTLAVRELVMSQIKTKLKKLKFDFRVEGPRRAE